MTTNTNNKSQSVSTEQQAPAQNNQRAPNRNEIKTMMQVDGRSAYSLATTGSIIFGATQMLSELFPLIDMNWILLSVVVLFASQMVDTWRGNILQIAIISLLLLNYTQGGNKLYTEQTAPKAPKITIAEDIQPLDIPVPEIPTTLNITPQDTSVSFLDFFIPKADAGYGGLPPGIVNAYGNTFLVVGGFQYPVHCRNGQWFAAVNNIWYPIAYNDGAWWYLFGQQWMIFPGQQISTGQWRW